MLRQSALVRDVLLLDLAKGICFLFMECVCFSFGRKTGFRSSAMQFSTLYPLRQPQSSVCRYMLECPGVSG